MAKLEVGKKAPAFTLINQDGEKVSLKDFAGQRVVLYFYPADDTPGCTTEACQFNDELKALPNSTRLCWACHRTMRRVTSSFVRSTA